MYLADALSRAYPDLPVPQSPLQSEFCHTMEMLDLAEHSPKRLKQIQEATSMDRALQALKEYIISGWPSQKSKVQPEACAYFKCQDELSVQEGILFKGSRIIIPMTLRREML